jgi:2-dehydro-3-deoxy-D-arabinonate dehydratase
MPQALFRVQLRGDEVRLARGSIQDGPSELLAPDVRLDSLLASGAGALARALKDGASAGACPADATILAPIEDQEVWCAGVTYERSKEARMEESTQPDFYDLVYDADRPELFFKANGWRVRGPGETIGVRADSGWDMAEPELGLVITADGAIAGYVIGNDMSSRTIEGDNPLYLPQAKVYDLSCSMGPAIVPASGGGNPEFPVRLTISRGGQPVFEGETDTARLRRSHQELTRHLTRALHFPRGVILLTGTGIVPDASITLKAGDHVRIEMGELGVLENPVVSIG